MLSLLPPTRRNLDLLEHYVFRNQVGSATIQTWHTGSPVIARCPQCGQPAVVVTDYQGGCGLHPFVDCLVSDHRTPLSPLDHNDLTLALRYDHSPTNSSVSVAVAA